MMTREQRDMAVAIAKDVIEQVRAENSYRMSPGIYISSLVDLFALSGDVKDHIGAIQKDCQVCMLGAAMLSKARLYDAVPVGLARNGSQEAMRHALADVFDDDTLDCLESAFELEATMGEDLNDMTRGAAVFGNEYTNAKDRAVAIADNIIENDGLFVVEPKTEEEYDAVLGEGDDDLEDYSDDWAEEDDEDLDDDEEDDL